MKTWTNNPPLKNTESFPKALAQHTGSFTPSTSLNSFHGLQICKIHVQKYQGPFCFRNTELFPYTTLHSQNCSPYYAAISSSWMGVVAFGTTYILTHVEKEAETYYYETFITELYVVVESWQQLKCPSTGKWINALWYIQIKL